MLVIIAKEMPLSTKLNFLIILLCLASLTLVYNKGNKSALFYFLELYFFLIHN